MTDESSPRIERSWLVTGVVAVLVAVVVAGLAIYDGTRSKTIAPGVKVGDVDVGGLDSAAAARKVKEELGPPSARTITVRYAGRRWKLTPQAVGARVDVDGSVAQALATSRGGWFAGRALRDAFGSLDRTLPLRVHYSSRALDRFAAKIGHSVDRAPQDATVDPSGGGLKAVNERIGIKVKQSSLRGRIAHRLRSPTSQELVKVPVARRKPKVTRHQLADKYPAYIVVDRESYTLRFYRHLKEDSSYPIAVGMQGLETPPGLYKVQWKQVDPPWYVPNSSWAGSLAGRVIPPGPDDPLKARFMGFNGGAGIHGIDPSEYYSIGHNASHGCVRMRIPDVIALYGKSPLGTPVYVS